MISSGSPHVRPMGVHRTCGEPDEIKNNTHPKDFSPLYVASRTAPPGLTLPPRTWTARTTKPAWDGKMCVPLQAGSGQWRKSNFRKRDDTVMSSTTAAARASSLMAPASPHVHATPRVGVCGGVRVCGGAGDARSATADASLHCLLAGTCSARSPKGEAWCTRLKICKWARRNTYVDTMRRLTCNPVGVALDSNAGGRGRREPVWWSRTHTYPGPACMRVPRTRTPAAPWYTGP